MWFPQELMYEANMSQFSFVNRPRSERAMVGTISCSCFSHFTSLEAGLNLVVNHTSTFYFVLSHFYWPAADEPSSVFQRVMIQVQKDLDSKLQFNSIHATKPPSMVRSDYFLCFKWAIFHCICILISCLLISILMCSFCWCCQTENCPVKLNYALKLREKALRNRKEEEELQRYSTVFTCHTMTHFSTCSVSYGGPEGQMTKANRESQRQITQQQKAKHNGPFLEYRTGWWIL